MSLQGNRTSASVEPSNLGFLASCNGNCKVPIKFQQGTQAASHFET